MRGEERKRAGRNRTLSVTSEEVEQLRGMVSTLSDIEQGENVLNKIIHADLLAIIDRIPNGFADLVIIDPPYNLTKDFHGMKFEAMDNGAYIGYLESLRKVEAGRFSLSLWRLEVHIGFANCA